MRYNKQHIYNQRHFNLEKHQITYSSINVGLFCAIPIRTNNNADIWNRSSFCNRIKRYPQLTLNIPEMKLERELGNACRASATMRSATTNALRMGFYERWMEKILRSSRRSVSQRTWRCDKNGLTYRLPVPSPFLIKHTCPDSVYARAARLKVFVMRKSSLNKYATRTIAVSLPRRWAIIAISRTIRTGRLG